MSPPPNAPARQPRTRAAPARYRLERRYPDASGHCIYCGAISRGRLCAAHNDLPQNDPAFAPNLNALAQTSPNHPEQQ